MARPDRARRISLAFGAGSRKFSGEKAEVSWDRGTQYTSFAFGHQLHDAGILAFMGRTEIRTTTRSARASSARSDASCSSARASRPVRRRASRSSSGWKPGTTRDVGTRRSTTSRRWSTRVGGSTRLRSSVFNGPRKRATSHRIARRRERRAIFDRSAVRGA